MRKRGKSWAVYGLVGIVAVILLVYLAGAVYYSGHLMRGTKINGIAVSGKTPAQVKQQLENYTLTITEKAADGSLIEQKVTGEQVGLTMSDEAAIKKLVKEQGIFSWIFQKKREYQVDGLVTLDQEKLSEMVHSLQGFSSANNQPSEDAHISQYQPDKGYEIVPETIGNQLDETLTLQKVQDAVLTLDTKLDLEKAGCYHQPAVTSEDEGLKNILEQMNICVSAKITYEFGDETEVLDGNTIHEWLKINKKKKKVSLKKKKLEEYVAGLRRVHDTIFTTRVFHTSYGKDVTIQGGDYGWWMNTNKEIQKLKKLITQGKTVTRSPEYIQEAASYGKKDYGNSYVEINLTAQHLFLYDKGKKVLESDFVSGNVSAGNGTPQGVYSLTYKEEMAELVGENYSTPVSYWMPFNGNIGMHDATWRSQFGGSIYKTSGSHGCINLPYDAAKKIFGYVEKGSPVICYELPGSEGGQYTGQSSNDVVKAVEESIDKIGKVTAASRKRVQHSRAIYNKLSASQRQQVSNYDKLVAAEKKLGL